jgi:hypothetical protein
VIGLSMFTFYKHPLGGPPVPALQALVLCGAWVVTAILYFASIAMMRVCIYSVTARVRSPFAT